MTYNNLSKEALFVFTALNYRLTQLFIIFIKIKKLPALGNPHKW